MNIVYYRQAPFGPSRVGVGAAHVLAPTAGTDADSRSRCAASSAKCCASAAASVAPTLAAARVGGAAPAPNFSDTVSAALANARRWSSAAARANFAGAGQPSVIAESTTTAAARRAAPRAESRRLRAAPAYSWSAAPAFDALTRSRKASRSAAAAFATARASLSSASRFSRAVSRTCSARRLSRASCIARLRAAEAQAATARASASWRFLAEAAATAVGEVGALAHVAATPARAAAPADGDATRCSRTTTAGAGGGCSDGVSVRRCGGFGVRDRGGVDGFADGGVCECRFRRFASSRATSNSCFHRVAPSSVLVCLSCSSWALVSGTASLVTFLINRSHIPGGGNFWPVSTMLPVGQPFPMWRCTSLVFSYVALHQLGLFLCGTAPALASICLDTASMGQQNPREQNPCACRSPRARTTRSDGLGLHHFAAQRFRQL